MYYYGQKLLVYENNTATWYTIQPGGNLTAEGTGSAIADTVSLLVEVDGENYVLDNTTDPQKTETADTYSVEVKT